MRHFLFKDRDGQTPLSPEMLKGLKIKNIQTIGELDEYEEENILEGLIWLDKYHRDPLDIVFWLKLHGKLFGKVWNWAGKIRNHELANPDYLTFIHIRPALVNLVEDIRFWFEHQTFEKQEIIARLHERLLTIHPFSNGNGRWSRILTESICKFHRVDIPSWNANLSGNPIVRRKNYIDAVVAARFYKNFSNLSQVIFS